MVLGLKTNPWIGTGFESFWLGPRLEFMRNALPNFPINEAHNGYLEVYLNLGWAGLCFVVVLLITGYTRIISGIRLDPEKGCLFMGFLLCSLFYCFSEAGFRIMTVSWFFLLLVIIGASHTVSRATDSRSSRLSLTTISSDETHTYSMQDASPWAWPLPE
jgi:exopolysaccharide production protein ExoQ